MTICNFQYSSIPGCGAVYRFDSVRWGPGSLETGPPRKLMHIWSLTRAFGTSTRGPSKILNRGPPDITLRHCLGIFVDTTRSDGGTFVCR
jgi:hypothetical protein